MKNNINTDIGAMCMKYVKSVKNVRRKLASKTLKKDDKDLAFATAFSQAFEESEENDKRWLNELYFFEGDPAFVKALLKANHIKKGEKIDFGNFMRLVNLYYAAI